MTDALSPLEQRALNWVLLCQRFGFDPDVADPLVFEVRTTTSTAEPGTRGVDVTLVPPGALEKMLTSDAVPSPAFRAAVERARQRRETGDQT